VIAATSIGASGADVDNVWVNGKIHRLLATVPAAVGKPTTTPYAIAPVDPSAPLHPLASARTKGFGAHDHVIADPTPKAAFKTVCKLTLTLPGARAKLGTNTRIRQTMTPFGQRPLLYAANLGNGMKPLTSVVRIKRARQLGLARFVITPAVFNCTIQPAS
jgi:hypothetical protein